MSPANSESQPRQRQRANPYHMTDVKPVVIFLHYYGTGPAAKLAQGVRVAVDLLTKSAPPGFAIE